MISSSATISRESSPARTTRSLSPLRIADFDLTFLTRPLETDGERDRGGEEGCKHGASHRVLAGQRKKQGKHQVPVSGMERAKKGERNGEKGRGSDCLSEKCGLITVASAVHCARTESMNTKSHNSDINNDINIIVDDISYLRDRVVPVKT